jgi:signal transduction histidine kinase/CheY-like chemotaxis protein
LTLVAGPAPVRSFPLNRASTIVGRDPGCNIVLSINRVSRRHARIECRDGGYIVEDLGSTAGTLLNGRPLKGPALLRDGDRIDIATYVLAFDGPVAPPQVEQALPITILGQRDTTGTAERALVAVRPEEKLAALLEVTRSLVGALDLGDVLEKVLEAMLRLFPQAERGLVLLEDEPHGGLALAALRVRRGEAAGPTMSRAIIDHVIGQGKAILCQDVTVDDRFGNSRSVDEALIRTLMCVPLRDLESRPAGILQLDASDPLACFTHEDLDVLAAVAGPVGLAVDNARLLGRARREQRRLEMVAEVGVELASSLDIAETMRAVARLVVPYLADLCLVDLLAEDGSLRRVAAAQADPALQPLADDLRLRQPLGLGSHDPAKEALRTGRVVESLGFDETLHQMTTVVADQIALTRGFDPSHILCLPLVASGRTLGVLTLAVTGARRPPGPADRRTAEELARRVASAAENSRLYREVREAGLAKDRFLAVLSHELRTPLTPVLLAVSAILDGDAPSDRPTLEMVRRNVELETRLIDDLLDVARIGRGSLRIDLEILDAHEAIRRAVEICRETTAGLSVVLDLSPGACHVRADPARLLQVLWNLIHNAAKFTPASGTLTIGTSVEPVSRMNSSGVLIVEFRDTGEGFEPDQSERIFRPFEQGTHGLRGRQEGLGLGLAISRSIAEAHGGRLTASSPGPDGGSTFRLSLPTVAAPKTAVTRPEPLPPADVIGQGLKVLLVEDNRDTLRYLATVLRLRGCEVAEAATLAEARTAAAEGFGLLLSDIELPDGTGLDLIRELGGARVAAIAMSGYGSVEDVEMSRAAGFVEHLTKPVVLRTLEAAIRRVTR